MSSFVGTPSLFFSIFPQFSLFSYVSLIFTNIIHKIILYIISLGERYAQTHAYVYLQTDIRICGQIIIRIVYNEPNAVSPLYF